MYPEKKCPGCRIVPSGSKAFMRKLCMYICTYEYYFTFIVPQRVIRIALFTNRRTALSLSVRIPPIMRSRSKAPCTLSVFFVASSSWPQVGDFRRPRRRANNKPPIGSRSLRPRPPGNFVRSHVCEVGSRGNRHFRKVRSGDDDFRSIRLVLLPIYFVPSM